MPANLTPQYRKAEEQYRQAHSPQAKIECLELMLRLIPRHKGTDRLQGELRARLKEARAELHSEQSPGKSGRSGRIPRQGAGTAIVIGGPNSGKSRLLKELTGAAPEVAPYPFTTRMPMAGMMAWEDIQIQLIDTPPLVPGSIDTATLSFLRSANLALLCIDGSDDEAISMTAGIIEELHQRKTSLDQASRFDEDDFSVIHLKTLGILTRTSAPDVRDRIDLLEQMRPLPFPLIPVEFDDPYSHLHLRARIGSALPVLRIYTRRPGESMADPAPVTLPIGATIADLAKKIHLELAAQLKFAKVWNAAAGSFTRTSTKRELHSPSHNGHLPCPAPEHKAPTGERAAPGKVVHPDHLLSDGDLVELY